MHIIGHQMERARLKRIAESNQPAQSYLFFGPQGVGKRLCALEFGCLLVGEPDFVSNETRPYPFDVLVVQPKEEVKRGVTKVKNISVDEIRDGLSFLGQYPASGRYRVVIIEDAHRLSQTAQNVLLKTLEEPNTSAVIILVTHEIGSIVGTIVSRVERVRFDFVPEEEITQGISQKAHDIAPFFFSLGRPGMIVRALEDPEGFSSEREKLEKLFRLSTLSLAQRMTLAEQLSIHVPLAVRLLEQWLPGLHSQALRAKEERNVVRFFSLLERVEQTLHLLKTTQSNARLLLETLFLSL